MASTSLSRTQTSGNTKIFTASIWLKRHLFSVDHYMFLTAGTYSSTNMAQMYFDATDSLNVQTWNSTPSQTSSLITNRKFRDCNAWYHIVVAYDTTQATSSDRVKIYVNGEQITSFSTENYPSQNLDIAWNENTIPLVVGNRTSASYHFPGSMAHVNYIDGTAYDASTFGETDATTGIWKPKTAPSVTYGTNGFFLKFENSGSMGTDSSGNGNNFTVNGTMTQTVDTPSNVFATLNPLNVPSSNAPTFANGNLFGESVTGGTSTVAFGGSSTLGVSQGKWYLEAKCGSSTNRDAIGVTGEASECARTNNSGISRTNSSYLYSGEIGQVYVNTVATGSFSTFTNNDIIMIALDLDNLAVYFGKNGTWGNSGDPTSGASKTGAISLASISSTTDGAYFINHGSTAGGGAPSGKSVFNFNFGNGYFGTVKVTSANSDTAGLGEFEYSVPDGYYSLCTKNLNLLEYS
jgi:hypothetical protein